MSIILQQNKKQFLDTTLSKYPNEGEYLLQHWNKKCNEKIRNEILQNFIKAAKTCSPTANLGSTVLLLISDNFLFLETSQNSSGGENVFVGFVGKNR